MQMKLLFLLLLLFIVSILGKRSETNSSDWLVVCHGTAYSALKEIIKCGFQHYEISTKQFDACIHPRMVAFINSWDLCRDYIREDLCHEIKEGELSLITKFTPNLARVCDDPGKTEV